jgi:hypothetical protein
VTDDTLLAILIGLCCGMIFGPIGAAIAGVVFRRRP